jgi:hypothetical protein
MGIDEHKTAIVTGRAEKMFRLIKGVYQRAPDACVKKTKILGPAPPILPQFAAHQWLHTPFGLLLAKFEARTGQNAL